MKNSVKLFFVGAALIGLAVTSIAQANNKAVVRDSRGEMVCTTTGSCVRTMWTEDRDECKKMISEAFAIYFDFGRASLNAKGKREVAALARSIKAKGAKLLGVRVVGFADRIGSPAKNEKLSKRRADAVRKYLVAKGVMNAKVLETRWFGDSVTTTLCPINMKKSTLVKCLQPDRRVEVEIDYATVK